MRTTIAILFLLVASSAGAQTVVPIQNPSFEQTSAPLKPDNCGFEMRGDNTNVYFVPGWKFEYGSVQFQPMYPRPSSCESYNIPVPPDGKNVAWLNGSRISQDLGIKASALQANDGLYVITFYVANFFTVYPGYYEAKIYFAPIDANGHYDLSLPTAHELCSTDGWAKRTWTQGTLVCPSPSYVVYDQWPDWSAGSPPVDPNAHVIISFSHINGWPILIDDISPLTFTPTN